MSDGEDSRFQNIRNSPPKFLGAFMAQATWVSLCLLPVLAVFAPASGAPIESPFMGTIEAPTSNAPVAPATAVPFSYSIVNWCEEGYNNYNVFLTQADMMRVVLE